jgi:LDH2 family malate/lactate/ureidoglycolate dehydrogenase
MSSYFTGATAQGAPNTLPVRGMRAYNRAVNNGNSEIRIPGERSYATRARLAREGIAIDRKIHDALGRLAEGNLDHAG